jgi:NAD(P)-dependent dehydrogenase (short-subunit alcohol dehydrogenase family)
MARTFAAEGANIVIVDICAPVGSTSYDMGTKDELQRVAEDVRKLGRECVAEIADVRDQEALESAVAQGIQDFGHIDIVCANAGIASFAPFWEMTDGMWNDMIDINLSGVWRTAKATAPSLIAQGSGSMILTSSICGREPLMDYAHYTAAKHGVLGLAKSFALELGRHNIRVNSLLPGPVNTYLNSNPGTRDILTGIDGATMEDMHAAIRHWTLLRGRGALPEQAIANAALWLASDEAEHVHALELVLDAGHMALPGYNHDPVQPS